MRVRYRVVAAAVVRTGAALDSAKAVVDKLAEGEEVVVTEQRQVGGQLRLKFGGGWTSQTARSGKVLLERVNEPEPQPQPQPEPEPQPEP